MKFLTAKLIVLALATVVITALPIAGAVGTADAPQVTGQAAKLLTKVSGIPVHISVPSVGIDVPIVNGTYSADTSTWTLNHAAAQYATVTPPVNTVSGNTFVYGHNNHLVFKYLLNIKAGAMVYVATDTGTVFSYRYTHSVDTAPQDVSIISSSTQPTLTLQTCVGAHYQTRRMFYFDYVNVQNR